MRRAAGAWLGQVGLVAFVTHSQEYEDAGVDSAADRDRAFARAKRHSRRVSLLKTALPVAAIVLGAIFVAYSYAVTPASVSINVAQSAISDGRLVMASPKLEGFTKDNRPYSMSAVRAFQDLNDMGLIELENISAELPFDADNVATMSSPGGLYDRNKNTLDLKGDLSIRTKDGMSAKLKSAFVDIATGSVRTDHPVEIKMNGASVSADSMQVQNNGSIMVFDKRVRMVIDDSYGKSRPKADGS